MARTREPETDSNDVPEKVTIPKGKSANVRTTISYTAELDNEKNETPNNDTESETSNGFREIPIRAPFRPFVPESNYRIKGNTLAAFFDALADEGEENYLIMITRLPDLPSESYNRPQVMYPATFPPMQCNASALPSFVQEIQKLNGNSGGRFDVRACLLSGHTISEAELTNFVVPNPPRNEHSESAGNGLNEMMQMFERMNADNNARIERLIEAAKPQESEMQELAKQMLMKRLLADDKPQSVNLEETMMKMFMMPSMVEVYAEKMRDAMNGGKQADNAPTWMKLLDSPFGQIIGEKAGTIAENLSQLAVVAASAKAQQVAQPNPEPVQNGIVQPQPIAPSEEIDEMKELVKDIFDELENGEPFNDDNEFLQTLKEDYPMEATFVEMLCQKESYEQLIRMLGEKAPELFEGLISVDPVTGQQAFNERGAVVFPRLEEFYLYMRGETPKPETVNTAEPVGAVETPKVAPTSKPKK